MPPSPDRRSYSLPLRPRSSGRAGASTPSTSSSETRSPRASRSTASTSAGSRRAGARQAARRAAGAARPAGQRPLPGPPLHAHARAGRASAIDINGSVDRALAALARGQHVHAHLARGARHGSSTPSVGRGRSRTTERPSASSCAASRKLDEPSRGRVARPRDRPGRPDHVAQTAGAVDAQRAAPGHRADAAERRRHAGSSRSTPPSSSRRSRTKQLAKKYPAILDRQPRRVHS